MKQVAFRLSDDGGPEGDRTLDLTDANRTLSQTELRARVKSVRFFIRLCFMGLCNCACQAPN